MAFKKPAVYQQAAVGQPTQLEHDVQEALANLLGHHNVGQWASDHSQEGKSFQGWNYLAIAAIGRQAARAHGYVYSAAPQAVAKRKAAMQTWGSLWKSMAQDGSADAVGDDNWVARMVDKPNRTQSGALFRWEFIQQMHLHGACIIWNRRSIDGSRTAARYIIPIALTEPVYQNQYQSAPNGGVKIHHYEAGLGFLANPLIRMLSGAVVPIEALSIIRYPHPYLRGDGQSPTDAGGWWIDSALMVDQVRWKHLKRGPRPLGFVSFDDKEISDAELDAAEKRINRKLADDDLDHKALALGGGAKLDRDTPPVDMEYVQAFDQIGQAILALHGVGKSMVGLTENMTYGSNAAAMQMALAVVQGDLDLLAGEWTQLAQDEGAQVTVEFETQPLDDPTLTEQQLGTDLQAGIRTGREWRAIRGLPPYGDWRDDARVTASGFVVDEPQPPKKAEQAAGEMQPAGNPFARAMTKGLAKAIPTGKPGPVIAVELDGTLAEYHGDFDENVIGHPNPVAIAKVNEMKRAGCRIVIFTCREDNELLRGWLAQAGVPYDAINENPDVAPAEVGSGKVLADVYWDDRAVNAAEGLDAIANLLPEGYSRNKLLTARGNKPGVVMLELPPQVLAAVRSDQARIDPANMTGDGLEEWPHITLLYGIVGVPISEVVEQVRRLNAIDVTFGQTSVFSGDVDVLKIEVHGEPIHAARAKLDSVLPVEHTYPDYQPHITLAELKPGTLYENRNNLIGAAATLTHAVVVVGDQRVRVPLRMTGLAATAPQAMSVMDDFRTVSLAKAQNIVDRALPMFADYQTDQFETKLSAIEKNFAEFMQAQREQIESLAKSIAPAPRKLTATDRATGFMQRRPMPMTIGEYQGAVKATAEFVAIEEHTSPTECLEQLIDPHIFTSWRQHAEEMERRAEELKANEERQVQALEGFAKAAATQGTETLGIAKALTQAIEVLSKAEPQPININVPESQPPIVQFTAPDQPVIVNVQVPEQLPPQVNVQVPEQLPPQVNVNVEPASVDLKLDVQAHLPPRTTQTLIERDANDLISRVTQVEHDAGDE